MNATAPVDLVAKLDSSDRAGSPERCGRLPWHALQTFSAVPARMQIDAAGSVVIAPGASQ